MICTAKNKTSDAITEYATNNLTATGRGGKYNFPQAVPPEDPADARRVLSEVLNWFKQERVKDDDELEERTIQFFSYCADRGERPTWEKYCLAIGYARNTVFEWSTGMKCSERRTNIIKKAKDVLAAYDAGMATEGKMNPVPYIFRAKNYYGMKDQADLVITPNNPLGSEEAPEAITQKYAELPNE